MAKEIVIGKRAKISEAEKHMIVAVLCASVVLGIAISLIIHFVKEITFNADVITAQEKSIALYSTTIKETGVCLAPKSGDIYSAEELKECDPESINVSSIPNTLRSDIIEKLAADPALNSVPKEGNMECYNAETGRNYTYKELKNIYDNAGNNPVDLQNASAKLKNCSALRIIPDALPAFKNVEALNASLDKLFRLSNHLPEKIGDNGASDKVDVSGTAGALYGVTVNLSIDAQAGITTSILDNIEHSIREFDIQRATIRWESASSLGLQALARAYYMDKSTVTEKTTTMKPEDK